VSLILQDMVSLTGRLTGTRRRSTQRNNLRRIGVSSSKRKGRRVPRNKSTAAMMRSTKRRGRHTKTAIVEKDVPTQKAWKGSVKKGPTRKVQKASARKGPTQKAMPE